MTRLLGDTLPGSYLGLRGTVISPVVQSGSGYRAIAGMPQIAPWLMEPVAVIYSCTWNRASVGYWYIRLLFDGTPVSNAARAQYHEGASVYTQALHVWSHTPSNPNGVFTIQVDPGGPNLTPGSDASFLAWQ